MALSADDLRGFRTRLGLTQAALGKRVGASQGLVSQWERGVAQPSGFYEQRLRTEFSHLAGAPGGDFGAASVDGEVKSKRAAQESSRPKEARRQQGPPTVDDFATYFDDGLMSVGRVVAIANGKVTLEVFRSPVPPEFEKRVVPIDAVTKFTIPCQTLVYHRRDRHWLMGRAVDDEDARHVNVRFPNASKPELFSTSDIYVRSARPDDDPTDLLAAQVTESPHFKDVRSKFVAFVNSQRASYRGLTALATARIDLHAHQLAAVRRVLSDPVHRYVLADEVGLGKTIEAGLLIVQHMIDEGEGARVVVLVPDSLLEQWRGELARSFGLKEESRLRLLPYGDLDTTDQARLATLAPTLTVIDEAHQTARWAFPSDSPDEGRRRRRYELVEQLTTAPKVLLLSGTPVLHHEDGFLSMLHLLEPDAYDLGDREGFRKRVAVRKVVADVLSELSIEFQPDFLKDALANLVGAVDADDELLGLVRTLRSSIDSNSTETPSRVEDLRSYLLERYKLHRRIIRTHRESKAITAEHLLPSRRGVSHYGTGEDRNRTRAAEALDEWRRHVQDGLDQNATPAIVRTFAAFVGAVLCHPRQLGRVFQRRAEDIEQGPRPGHFVTEAAWLRNVARVLLSPETDARTAALVELLVGPLATKRAVVFVDAPEEAKHLVVYLRSHPTLGPRVQAFAGGPTALKDAQILVCDRTAEEGLNLQRGAKAIVFHDLPFDVGRIEQRIGRFDRLEGMKELRFWTPTPVGSYEVGWTELLRDQVKIFERSVARLQYVLADAIEQLRSDVFDMGPEEAFEVTTNRFCDPGTGIDANLKQLRRQEALDATEWRDDELQGFAQAISHVRLESPSRARAAIEGWLTKLSFKIAPTEAGVYYAHVTYARGVRGSSTLMPLPIEHFLRRWQAGTSRTAERTSAAFGPFLFDPEDDSADGSLLCIGHPFFDGMFNQMSADDRSRSWGIWRIHSGATSPQVYVCFEFSIETDLAKVPPSLRRWKALASVRRRADETFAVEHRSIWLDMDGTPVDDSLIEQVLRCRYDKERRPDPDRNLNRERWGLANQRLFDVIPDWAAHIHSLRSELELRVREEPALLRRSREAENRLGEIERRAVRILRSRAAHAPVREKQALERAAELETEFRDALQWGVRNPKLVVDNVGVVVLAAESLE